MAGTGVATAGALLRASHLAPTLAVTTVAALLAAAAGLSPRTGAVLTLAVLAGQLSIGWSNDLLDADRDARVGRRDKPLVTGALSRRLVRRSVAAALVVCVVASLAVGLAAGLVHLLAVAAGWAYNLRLKGTLLSWLPYTVAFGALPTLAWLAQDPARLPPGWMVAAGSLLGAGAHLVNVVPDLADDAATGVRGLPHRLGARRSVLLALACLTAASAVAVLGPAGPTPGWAWAVLAMVGLLAAVAVRAGGRALFRAAMGIALLDVVMLVLRGV
ncbi:UbiA family prenyltransferase [Georgenia sp. TF02-10]|uniref:UbiA family prenyltransferase n=1 Tax=Georgenia sp. TF02-10 TaxID=2917725 RepID=UPI001FA77285|nr:UbiA family prenyltransferase [Georgenia sp. TF02-10]UNX54776.1 UbiA family prenyltransferase [Georgenia sp. TF02-10]